MNTLQHSSDIVGMATEIPAWACRELMGSTLVGRVAFVDEDGPVVLPVNFVLDGDTVLFCTSSANAIGRHLDSATVEFEVHEFDGPTKSGWSVVVRAWLHSFRPASCRRTRDSALLVGGWGADVRRPGHPGLGDRSANSARLRRGGRASGGSGTAEQVPAHAAIRSVLPVSGRPSGTLTPPCGSSGVERFSYPSNEEVVEMSPVRGRRRSNPASRTGPYTSSKPPAPTSSP